MTLVSMPEWLTVRPLVGSRRTKGTPPSARLGTQSRSPKLRPRLRIAHCAGAREGKRQLRASSSTVEACALWLQHKGAWLKAGGDCMLLLVVACRNCGLEDETCSQGTRWHCPSCARVGTKGSQLTHLDQRAVAPDHRHGRTAGRFGQLGRCGRAIQTLGGRVQGCPDVVAAWAC